MSHTSQVHLCKKVIGFIIQSFRHLFMERRKYQTCINVPLSYSNFSLLYEHLVF